MIWWELSRKERTLADQLIRGPFGLLGWVPLDVKVNSVHWDTITSPHDA
jgi:hypothetical protein